MYLRLCYVLPACVLAALICGCGDYRAVNEGNPEFQKAETCRRDGRFDLAIRHYEECLRLSPDSHRAHLQLAMIYEDHKQDLPRAIVHYEAYLDTADAESLLEVRQLLERAQQKYLKQLQARFPQSDEPPANPPAEPATPPFAVAALPVPVCQVPPESPLATEPPPRTHTVRPGDNLSRISAAAYGTTRHADRIYAANRDQLDSPDRLRVGQILKLPVIENVAGAAE